MNGSPFDMEDPTSAHGAWLKRRFGLPLTPQHMGAIVEANSNLVPDDAFRSLLLDVLAGKTGSKRGRPAHKPSHVGLMILAELVIEDRAEEIRRERKARPKGKKRMRGEAEPVVAAADEIAGQLNYATGRGLLNAISALKRMPLFRE